MSKRKALRRARISVDTERERTYAEKTIRSLHSRIDDISDGLSYMISEAVESAFDGVDLEEAVCTITSLAEQEHAITTSDPYKQGWNDAVAAMSGLMMKSNGDEEEERDEEDECDDS